MVRKRSGNVRKWSNMVRKWSIMIRKCQKMSGNCSKWSGNGPKWPGNVRKWSGNSQKMSKNYPKNGQEMSSDGLKLSGYCLKLTNNPKRGENTFSIVQPEHRRREGWQQKKETLNHPPHFMVQFFFCVLFLFCVLFFSFCSNLSVWPGRQDVPYGSRCYTPIFDGLVSAEFITTFDQTLPRSLLL